MVDLRKSVWAFGKIVEVEELPIIAGPEPKIKDSNKKIKVGKFKVERYKRLSFPEVSISEKELSNYMQKKDAIICLEFENPLNREINFKVQINGNDFQRITLLSAETKKINYIYKSNKGYGDGKINDPWILVVVNDFFEEKHIRGGYLDYDESYFKEYIGQAQKTKTVIYVDQHGSLEHFLESQ